MASDGACLYKWISAGANLHYGTPDGGGICQVEAMELGHPFPANVGFRVGNELSSVDAYICLLCARYFIQLDASLSAALALD